MSIGDKQFEHISWQKYYLLLFTPIWNSRVNDKETARCKKIVKSKLSVKPDHEKSSKYNYNHQFELFDEFFFLFSV